MKQKKLAVITAVMGITAAFAGTAGYGGQIEARAASDGETVKITYMQWQQEFQTAAIALADAYHEEHPNVTVEVITQPEGYSTNLKTNIASGDVPEIFMTEGYENMKSFTDYITDLSDQPWVEDISGAAKECVTLDGKVLGMPITMAGEGIVYNRKMFEEHGWEVPQTLTELKELCERIQAEGITPFSNQFGDDWLLGQLLSGSAYAYIPDTKEFNQKVWDGEETLSGNEQMKNHFTILDLMLEYGQDNCMSYGWNETCTDFAIGTCAMCFEGDWIWDTIYAIDPDIDCGMFAVPATENPEDTKMIVDANGCFHVGKGSDHPEAAMDYLNWIASSDTAREIMLKEFRVIPVFDGWEYQADNQLALSTIEYLEAGKTFQWSWPQWPAGFQYAAGRIDQDYISGSVNAAGALENMDAQFAKLASSAGTDDE